MAGKLSVTICDDDGNDLELPGRYEICPDCDGHGVRALGGMAITSSEWEDWDCEEREGYFRGDYDTTCECCNGSGKIVMVDEDRLSDDEKRMMEAYYKCLSEARQTERNERLMCGDW
jgi:hypothetical protein